MAVWNDFLFDGVRGSGEYTDTVIFLLVCPNLPRHTEQFFNEYLESCLTDVTFCLSGKYVMFNR